MSLLLQQSSSSAPQLDRFSAASEFPNENEGLAEKVVRLELELDKMKHQFSQDTSVMADKHAALHTPVKDSTHRPVTQEEPVNPISSLPELLNLCMGMPRKEIPKFSGSPLDYWKFFRGFTNGVAQYVTDPANRLSYLIHYCEGEAREAIDHCTILDPCEGYKEAWRILKRRFGEPGVIAHEHLSKVTDGPVLKPNDVKSIVKLAETMKACELTLSQLDYNTELNTRSTLGAVINRLPGPMQSKWFDQASNLFRMGREPRFSDLTRFIQDRADAAVVRSIYTPQQVMDRTEHVGDPQYPPRRPRVYTLATQAGEPIPTSPTQQSQTPISSMRPVCLNCGFKHYLDQCSKFLSMHASARQGFVRSAALCELCLKPRHTAEKCRSRKFCGLDHCRALHHPLLHVTSETNSKQGEGGATVIHVNTNSAGTNGVVSLGVVKVKLRGPGGECVVNALLDSGSDSTMLLQDTAERIGLKGDPTTINVSTVNCRSTLPSSRVSVHVSPLSSESTEVLVNAWTVKQLPHVTRLIPTARSLSRWKHLTGLPIDDIVGTAISMLIGMDVPSAHWVLDSRTGRPNEPYACLTPFGWTILGPLETSNLLNTNCQQIACWKDAEVAYLKGPKQLPPISKEFEVACQAPSNQDGTERNQPADVANTEDLSSTAALTRTNSNDPSLLSSSSAPPPVIVRHRSSGCHGASTKSQRSPSSGLPKFWRERLGDPPHLEDADTKEKLAAWLAFHRAKWKLQAERRHYFARRRPPTDAAVAADGFDAFNDNDHGGWVLTNKRQRVLERYLIQTRMVFVKDEKIHTALVGNERTLNDRPLVKESSDTEDDAALTPNHLLLSRRNTATADTTDGNLTLNKRWRTANDLANHLWHRWKKKYLPTLQTVNRWLMLGRGSRVADSVLIGNQKVPRGQWAKGIVERAHGSSDGRTREVLVRTTNGVHRRDVRQLYMLEASEEAHADDHSKNPTAASKGLQ